MMVYSEENITKLRIKEFIDYLDLKVRKFIDSCDEIGEGDEWVFSAQETIINLDEFKENFDKTVYFLALLCYNICCIILSLRLVNVCRSLNSALATFLS